jgi:hypothetical protein
LDSNQRQASARLECSLLGKYLICWAKLVLHALVLRLGRLRLGAMCFRFLRNLQAWLMVQASPALAKCFKVIYGSAV